MRIPEHIKDALKQYAAGLATDEQKEVVRTWFDSYDDEIMEWEGNEEEYRRFMHTLERRVNNSVSAAASKHRVRFMPAYWVRYAAAVLLLVGAAVWWEISRSTRNDDAAVTTASKNQDVQPGTNRAILTIGNQSVTLSNSKTGIAVGNAITYNDGEKIVGYLSSATADLIQLATPRGGQYQAVLPDGSRVWLNAASGIRFPSKFTGNKREIEVNGEVYLEVAKNSKQPFYVHTHKTTVQVLGTSFNINAYEDEQTERTTLIDGSVRVIPNNGKGVILQPGQQSVLTQDAQLTTQQAGIEKTLAWKNGLFDFNNTDFTAVMRQLERWYDIEVKYEGVAPKLEFRGAMQRNLTLTQLVSILKKMEINYRLEDRTLIIKN